MTNKYMFFIANWKMFGDQKSLNSLNKVIKFSKINKNSKFKLIYCPPYTLLDLFYKKLKNTNIEVGAQNCHENESYGAYTGSINSKMIKKVGAKYVIIGHSENRAKGESDALVNEKIKSSIKNGLKIIFCIGETLSQRKKRLTQKILTNQIIKGLKGIKKLNNILFAYEPIWSIGTGKVPKIKELDEIFIFIKKKIKTLFKTKKSPIVLYGGSVNDKNIRMFSSIPEIDGFLIGGASQSSKKFIDIIKNYYK